jgi:hypothetical protein
VRREHGFRARCAALNGTGVYAGTLLIGATIENSRLHRNGSAPVVGERPMPVVAPGDLADRLWDMYKRQDRVEDVVAPALAADSFPSTAVPICWLSRIFPVLRASSAGGR